MAVVSLTTSPSTLDAGTSETVTVTNTGTVAATVTRGSQVVALQPTQSVVVYPEGTAVTALVASGSGQVTTGVTAKSLPNAADPATLAANVAFTGTYGQLWATPTASVTLTGTLSAWTVTAVDCTAGAGARSLPAASSVAVGTAVCAKKADTSANPLTVSRAGSDLIYGTGAGATSKVLTLAGEAVEFVSNGVDKWTVRSSDTPSGVLASTYLTQASGTSTYGPAIGSDAWLKLHAGGNLDALITGTITRDSNGAVTAASVVWPDGTTGVYAGTASSSSPGAIDTYTVTYVGSVTKTVTQPTVTRGATGAVTTRPAMTVA